MILDDKNIGLDVVLDKFIELGLDFDLCLKLDNMQEKLYSHIFDFEKNKYSIEEILSIIQEKKLNRISGEAHMIFHRSNIREHTDCVFIFGRNDVPLKLNGVLLGKTINVELPCNTVLVLIINSNDVTLKATYLKTPKTKSQYKYGFLMLDEQQYKIEENITTYIV